MHFAFGNSALWFKLRAMGLSPEQRRSVPSFLSRNRGRPHRNVSWTTKFAIFTVIVAVLYFGLALVPGRTRRWAGVDSIVSLPLGGSSLLRIQRPVCDDICSKAGNGVCNEPRNAIRGQPSTQAMCDLGTDCSDCGPWKGHHVTGTWLHHSREGPGPIAYARSQIQNVRIKRTTTIPSFLLPITDAKSDPDVSAMLEGYGAMEGGITRAMLEILGSSCYNRKTGRRQLVVEVGAGHGYYTMLAARYGCRVIAWEPVPLYRAYLALAAALNNVTDLVEIRDAAVSDLPTGSTVKIGIPERGTYRGLASVNNLNLLPNEVKEVISVRTERLDDVIGNQDVLLLKVDVEGYEAEVLRSGAALTASPRTRNILVEYSPGISERNESAAHALGLAHMLVGLIADGFALGHMPTFEVAAPWPPKPMLEWYHSPFPVLEEVGLDELYHDVRAILLKNASMPNCTVPSQLRRYNTWNYCKEWARWVDPKGFRSSFGYNTNIWASRQYKRLGVPDNSRIELPEYIEDTADFEEFKRTHCSAAEPSTVADRVWCNQLSEKAAEEEQAAHSETETDGHDSEDTGPGEEEADGSGGGGKQSKKWGGAASAVGRRKGFFTRVMDWLSGGSGDEGEGDWMVLEDKTGGRLQEEGWGDEDAQRRRQLMAHTPSDTEHKGSIFAARSRQAAAQEAVAQRQSHHPGSPAGMEPRQQMAQALLGIIEEHMDSGAVQRYRQAHARVEGELGSSARLHSVLDKLAGSLRIWSQTTHTAVHKALVRPLISWGWAPQAQPSMSDADEYELVIVEEADVGEAESYQRQQEEEQWLQALTEHQDHTARSRRSLAAAAGGDKAASASSKQAAAGAGSASKAAAAASKAGAGGGAKAAQKGGDAKGAAAASSSSAAAAVVTVGAPSPAPKKSEGSKGVVMGDGTLQLKGYASLFPQDQPLSGKDAKWISNNRPNTGLGRVRCNEVGAPAKVVRRCPCTEASCKEEEAAVKALMEVGLMIFN